MRVQEVVRQMYEGDKDARDILWIYLWNLTRLLAKGHVRGEDADELAFVILCDLIEELDRQNYDPEESSLLTWAATRGYYIAVNFCADLHETKSIPAVDIPYDSPKVHDADVMGVLVDAGTEKVNIQEDEMSLLYSLIYELPNENWRKTLLMQYSKGLTQQEIADKLGTTPNVVSQWRQRAIESLKSALNKGV